MRVLKTIVATAVIVFALTTVAMAGVQHITKSQSAQAPVRAPVHHAVTLATQRRNAAHVYRAHSQASAAHRVAHEARAQHVDHGQGSGQRPPEAGLCATANGCAPAEAPASQLEQTCFTASSQS